MPGTRLCSAVATKSETLAEVLERHELSDIVVPATADPATVDKQLNFLSAIEVVGVEAAIRNHPEVLQYDPHFAAPRIEYLLSLGVHEIGKVVGRHPSILGCDVTNDMHQKVAILQALGVSSIAQYMTRNPSIVHLNVESQMRPAVEFYRTIPFLKLGKLLTALPSHTAFAPLEETQKKLDYCKAPSPPPAPITNPTPMLDAHTLKPEQRAHAEVVQASPGAEYTGSKKHGNAAK